MFNFYEFVDGNPTFKQFNVDELLFTAYDCIIEESPLDYWTQKNYFVYTVRGHIKWKTPSDEYIIGVGEGAFVNKGAHRVYKLLDDDYCALLIFMPDEFIKSVIRKHLPEIRSEQTASATDSVIPLELDDVLSTYFTSVLNYFSQPAPPSKSLLNSMNKRNLFSLPVFKQAIKIIRKLKPGLKSKITSEYYKLYDVSNTPKELKGIGKSIITSDGHPMFHPTNKNLFVNDTYPEPDQKQTLMLFDIDKNKRTDLQRFEVPDKFIDFDLKCDLHPRFSRTGKYICIDSAHSGKRQVYILETPRL